MRQLFDLGSQFRALYSGPNAANPNFLPPHFDANLHVIRSSNLHRTLQSAQSFGFGMYIGEGPFDDLTNSSLPGNFQPVPVRFCFKLNDGSLQHMLILPL